MTPTLRVEIFPSDLTATIWFYTQVLGFKLLRHEPHIVTAPGSDIEVKRVDKGYAYFTNGHIQLGADGSHPTGSLKARPEHRRPPTAVELVMEFDDLDMMRKQVREHQWPVRVDEETKLQSWGLRDFRMEDPDGHFIRISEKSSQQDGTGF